MKKLTLLLILACTCRIQAQTEYLVTVDPSDISFVKIDTIHTVAWVILEPASYDQDHGHYIFQGADTGFNQKLYTIDAITGAVIYDPACPVLDPGDNIAYRQYSDSLDQLLGIYWDNSAAVATFGTIDQATGAFSALATIPGVSSLLESAYDNNSNRYLLRITDSTSGYRLLSIDASTGAVVSSVACLAPPNAFFSSICYSNSLDQLFALQYDPVTSTINLVTVDPLTAAINNLGPVPGVTGVESSFTTFDEYNKRYVFKGLNNSGVRSVYSLDALTGAVVFDPAFPALPNPENIILPRVDQESGVMYALHWEMDVTAFPQAKAGHIRGMFPNPCTGNSRLVLDKAYEEVKAVVYDSFGKAVKVLNVSNSAEIAVSCEGLAKGLYTVTVIANHEPCGAIQMMVE